MFRWHRIALSVLTLTAIHGSSAALASDYSAQTHFFAVEYLKPVAGMEDLSTLNVTFNRKLDAPTAERVLREELQRAVSLFPPKGDIMAHAWTETDPRPGSEETIPLSDGSSFLIFSRKTRRTQTEKQYDLSRQQPAQPGKGIRVDLALALERGADGRARIVGRTNLPPNMSLMIDLRRVGSKYFAQDKVEVLDGRIASSWFSDGGRPLVGGTYEIEVTSPLPDFQPPAVRAAIGKSGQNLSGPVSTRMGSKMIEYKTRVVLK